MRLMLLGSPGAGKGTQAQFITEQFQIPVIGTGEILRAAVAAGSPLGLEAQRYMTAGKLVPDATIIGLVKERLQQPDCQRGFLLDGFPRTIPQAQSLLENGIDLDYVIEIKVPEAVLIERLSGRRSHPASGRIYHIRFNPPKVADKDDLTGEPLVHRTDDYPETITKRLAVYQQQTEPLVNFYKAIAQKSKNFKPRYIEIDGTLPVETVKTKIFAAIQGHSDNNK